jgi:mannose-6-phosphate isomerase-like protein (cupin superfamily)
MFNEKVVGGLVLKSVSDVQGVMLLGSDPYEYRAVFPREIGTYELTGGDVWCFHLYATGGEHAEVSVSGTRMVQGQTFWVSGSGSIQVEWLSGRGMLLVGSKVVGFAGAPESRLFGQDEVKKVLKPWGYELWLTGDPSPHFAFKRIFIKAGTKTSLQYHEKKRETNFLIEGEADLHYNPDSGVPASEFHPANVRVERLSPGTVVDVQPMRIHRLEAVSDILLCEVSTPELDDVVRISDDSGRRDGRVESEHKV